MPPAQTPQKLNQEEWKNKKKGGGRRRKKEKEGRRTQAAGPTKDSGTTESPYP